MMRYKYEFFAVSLLIGFCTVNVGASADPRDEILPPVSKFPPRSIQPQPVNEAEKKKDERQPYNFSRSFEEDREEMAANLKGLFYDNEYPCGSL